MSTIWRLVDTGQLPAAHNMALDKVILTARSRDWVGNTVRFLQFAPACALVGYHQSVEMEVEEEFCRRHGLEINRRITGGGNLFFDDSQLGWEIFARKDTPGMPEHLDDMYRLMCESAVAGLAKLGVKAKYRPKNDIEVDGRKICGSGGTEIGSAFMYQGTLLNDFDVDTMLGALKLPIKKLEDKQIKSFKQRVTCLREVLGYVPPMEKIKKAMAEGFAEVFGIGLQPTGLCDQELELFTQVLPQFKSDDWIRGPRRLPQDSSFKTTEFKAPGGLIRISALLDSRRHRIKSIFITGDFFAYPERSILDLEAVLKNASSHSEDIRNTVEQFFADHQVQIPGVMPEDLIQAIHLAVVEVGGRDEQKAI